MGRRWTPENLPSHQLADLALDLAPAHRSARLLQYPALFKHVMILHGCAVGGGSITYANTSLVPRIPCGTAGSWAGLAAWKREMPPITKPHPHARRHRKSHSGSRGPHPETSRRRRGHRRYFLPHQGRRVRSHPRVRPGQTCPDPYFGGEGPERCHLHRLRRLHDGVPLQRQEQLDKNYLYFAEKHGARVFAKPAWWMSPSPAAGRRQRRLRSTTVKSTAWLRARRSRFTCRGVVFAASALGTMDLLFRLKQKGSLPAISDQLGNRVRTNAESLIGVRVPQPARIFRRASPSARASTWTTIPISRRPAIPPVPMPWACWRRCSRVAGPVGRASCCGCERYSLRCLRHPFRTVRVLHPFGWARESIILLCMQTLDGYIDMRMGRPWFWPFRKTLMSHGNRIPTFIPQANEFARKAAALMGGVPMSMVTEILFDVPGTAHVLGGCPIAGLTGPRRRRPPPPRLRLQEYVCVRWLRDRRQPGRQSKPHYLRANGARHELHPTRRGNALEPGGRALATMSLSYPNIGNAA
jgi:cholesterol oxidase